MSMEKLHKKFPSSFDDFSNDLLQENIKTNINWQPAINVKENQDFEIEIAVPGFSKEQLKVSVLNNMLTIEATSKKEEKKTDNKYSVQEFFYNSFKKSIALPNRIDFSKKIKAKYENGVLRIQLDKLDSFKNEEHKKKVIEIK